VNLPQLFDSRKSAQFMKVGQTIKPMTKSQSRKTIERTRTRDDSMKRPIFKFSIPTTADASVPH
jgi:hypothetical protein